MYLMCVGWRLLCLWMRVLIFLICYEVSLLCFVFYMRGLFLSCWIFFLFFEGGEVGLNCWLMLNVFVVVLSGIFVNVFIMDFFNLKWCVWIDKVWMICLNMIGLFMLWIRVWFLLDNYSVFFMVFLKYWFLICLLGVLF